MSNYGRGWGDGYGGQSRESVEKHWDEEAAQEGDWEWLSQSPRQQRLRQEQGLGSDQYSEDLRND